MKNTSFHRLSTNRLVRKTKNTFNFSAKYSFTSSMENILVINLLGKRFPIPSQLVFRYPHTLLGNQELLSKYYRTDRNDYYFERNSLLFPYIFTDYTSNKKIFCPRHIPLELIKKECEFFQLSHPQIYRELTRLETYQYFPRTLHRTSDFFLEIIPFVLGLAFLLTTSMERRDNSSSYLSWSFIYFMELFSTLFLSSTLIYQMIFLDEVFQRKSFFVDLFSAVMSITSITLQTVMTLTTQHWMYIFVLICKIFRLSIVIVHLQILRLIVQTFIQRYGDFIV